MQKCANNQTVVVDVYVCLNYSWFGIINLEKINLLNDNTNITPLLVYEVRLARTIPLKSYKESSLLQRLWCSGFVESVLEFGHFADWCF